jgi:hypothetical protein
LNQRPRRNPKGMLRATISAAHLYAMLDQEFRKLLARS